MSVRGNIEHTRVARVNDDVVNEQMRAVEIVEQPPSLRAVCRSVNLTVERPEVEARGIVRVNDERAHVAARRACRAPVHSILRIGFWATRPGFDSWHTRTLCGRERDSCKESKEKERTV